MAKYGRISVIGAFGLSAALLAFGCGDDDPIEELEQVVDCFEICDRYEDCVEEIDVSACTDACEDMIEVSSDVRRRADDCEDCLDDRSCAEIEAAACWDDCPVVPLED